NGNEMVGDKALTLETIIKLAPKSYEIVNYSRNTQDIWRSVADCDFMISTRLHAAIFACFSDTPFMLNEYHRKCSDFLEDVGYDDGYRLFDAEFDVADTSRKILAILNHSNSYIAPKYIAEMKSLALLNFNSILL